MNLCKKLFLLFLISFIHDMEAAKILGIFHIPGRSHYFAGNTLMKILAAHGHEVTIVSLFEEKNVPENYKQIVLTGLFDQVQNLNNSMFALSGDMPILSVGFYNFIATGMVEDAFKHPNFQKLMNSNETFDAVIIEAFQSDPLKYVAHRFNAICIQYSSLDANKWVNPFVGNPDPPSYVPSFYLRSSSRDLKFFKRIYNTILWVLDNLMLHFITLPHQNKMLHKYFPEAPPLTDYIYNTSLVLLNSDWSIYESKTRVPNMIDIGGFHIEEPKALPDDLMNILDNATEGVIYFSLGTNLICKDMPLQKRQMILNALSKQKQLVLWKYEDDLLPNKPDNVIIRKWFPQNDLLAHKNIVLFINHGGIFGTMEAIYHGIPALSIPVTTEQVANSIKATNNGYARFITYSDLTEEEFTDALHDMLENPKYRETARKCSKIMRDKPLSRAETINYWVDYVIRHKGADHLRVTSLNLPWYQYLLLDVIAFSGLLLLSILYILRMIFKFVFKNKKASTIQVEKTKNTSTDQVKKTN